MITRKQIIVHGTISCREDLSRISCEQEMIKFYEITLEHFNWSNVNWILFQAHIKADAWKWRAKILTETRKDYDGDAMFKRITWIVPDGSNPGVKFRSALDTPLNCHSACCAFLSRRGQKLSSAAHSLGHYRRAFSDLMAPTKRHPCVDLCDTLAKDTLRTWRESFFPYSRVNRAPWFFDERKM